jgi:predicted component of type VI protein secretion system
MKWFSWALLSMVLACGGNASGGENYDDRELSETVYEEADINGFVSEGSAVAVPKIQEQKIVKESFLRFETQDLDKTYKNILTYTQQNKGYVQTDESGKGYRELNRRLIVRIPTENFQKTLDAISKDVTFFDTKRISAKDVTEEFIDIEARLKAKKALEERYTQLLNKANSVKEILEVERELSKIREEIEAKQGRLKYLSNKVAYSTLTVEFYKQTAETGITVSYGTKMLNALKSGFNGISLFFLGLLHIWPFLIVLIIAFIIIRKKFFKKKTS